LTDKPRKVGVIAAAHGSVLRDLQEALAVVESISVALPSFSLLSAVEYPKHHKGKHYDVTGFYQRKGKKKR
jgi:hypothetical protein